MFCRYRRPLLFTLLMASNLTTYADSVAFYGDAVLGHDHYDGFFVKNGTPDTHTFVRRLKMGVEFNPSKNWEIELEAKYENIREDKTEPGDIKIAYDGFSGRLKPLEITMGHMKMPFGLERQQSFSDIPSVERTLSTTAFAPGRQIGIRLDYDADTYTFALGGFSSDDYDRRTSTLSARMTVCFCNETFGQLHLGASARWQDVDQQRFQLKERAEVVSGDTVLRSARFNADEYTVTGLELLWLHQNWSIQGEAYNQQVEQSRAQNDGQWQYSGHYLQSSWMLTGEYYRYKQGKLRTIKPNSAYGAWELIARSGELDLHDHGIGSMDEHWLIGLNAYLPSKWRWSINYLEHHGSADLKGVYQNGEAITMRIQYEFN